MPFSSIYAALESTCLKQTDKKAITFFRDGIIETELTYSHLLGEINKVSLILRDMGAKKGKTVVIFLEKSVISIIAHFALLKIGAICVPLNPGFKHAEMTYLLKDSDPALVITDRTKSQWIQQIIPGIKLYDISTTKPYQTLNLTASIPEQTKTSVLPGLNDPGLIIYTSGTTGNPKGAVLTQSNLIHDAANIIDIWQISNKDTLCHTLPLFHIHGLCFALHTTLLTGGHILLLDQFIPKTVVDILSDKTRDICSIFMAVPAMYTKIMDLLENRPVDFSHLRLLTCGSAPLLETEFERIHRLFGKAPVEREGMSETGMNFSNPIDGEKIPGSIGLPLPGLDVRIVNPDTFQDKHSGEIGEIWLTGPAITSEYWKKPKETQETFVDGWFRTGDLGWADKNNYYYITDRIKHIIISGGENVSAKEVENSINILDGVKETAVVGIPDAVWGEKVAAAIVRHPESELTIEDIKKICKKNLHDWKCPKQIIFVDELPKNTMGKVLKEEIKKLF